MKSVKIRTCNVFHFCCNVRRNYFCHHFICIIICHSEMEASQQWRRICSQVSLENLGQGQPANVDSFWDTPVLVTDDGNKMCWWQFYISVANFALSSQTISIYFHWHKQDVNLSPTSKLSPLKRHDDVTNILSRVTWLMSHKLCQSIESNEILENLLPA